ncbi:MAG TPA: hypothetical protein VG873_00725 [Burkholderiales bacterium]|nr:hypothetical protein [Burkholderiales bacterium]
MKAFLLAVVFLVSGYAIAQPEEEEVSAYGKNVSCTTGPYRVKLPKSYRALKRLAVLKRERLVREEDGGALRELRFVGAELLVFTSRDKPDQYTLARATFTTSKWRIMGPLRVGAPASLAVKGLPVKPVPRYGEITLEGDGDAILLTVAGGRVQEIDYECGTE